MRARTSPPSTPAWKRSETSGWPTPTSSSRSPAPHRAACQHCNLPRPPRAAKRKGIEMNFICLCFTATGLGLEICSRACATPQAAGAHTAPVGCGPLRCDAHAGERRRTRCVRCAPSAQTAAASMFTSMWRVPPPALRFSPPQRSPLRPGAWRKPEAMVVLAQWRAKSVSAKPRAPRPWRASAAPSSAERPAARAARFVI